MAYQPKITVGAHVVLADGRAGKVVTLDPDRPTESTGLGEDIKVTVRLENGEQTVVAPEEIAELTPPSGAEPERD
jgi:hypothetical protein